MLGSHFDEERLNALSMLQRMADSYKVPIHELLLGTNGSEATGSDCDRQRAERAGRETREANLRAARAEQAAREVQSTHPAEPGPDAPKLPSGWRDLFSLAQQMNHARRFLTDWEANFVADLLARGARHPSPKQTAVIARILETADVFAAAHAVADWEEDP
jgi:hypothetical protein